jgi:hypothetical protein
MVKCLRKKRTSAHQVWIEPLKKRELVVRYPNQLVTGKVWIHVMFSCLFLSNFL